MLVAVLAAGGTCSVAQAQRTGETGDQTALAVPRIGLRGTAGVGLPQPLSPSEAAQVRRIFFLQNGGLVAEAVRETERLQNDLVLGAILADRYLRGQPTAAELSAWLTRFGDQPEAPAIRAMLERLPTAAQPATDAVPLPHPAARFAPSQARALFVQNRDSEAVSAALAPQADADALLAGGLAAVRLTRRDEAVNLFASAYRTASTSALRAASAFWAGHVAQRAGDRGGFAEWMRRAAAEGDNFYGLIARRALGPAVTCIPNQTLGNADLDALLATAQGRRAFALLQVGEQRLAEAELRSLWLDTARDGLFDRSIILAARAVGFGDLAAEIEQRGYPRSNGTIPVTLRPASGFVVDPPLVYALVRHESNFRPGAVSASGARGLMQIMPRTAHAVAGGQAEKLQDPAVNLAIGQRLLLTLAGDEAIEGDLIRMLAAYNQGQGGLRKWLDMVRDHGDPLMFIEAIPNSAARAFVRDSLVYSWRYAAELRLPAVSLDALAAGRYPRLVRAGEPANNNLCSRLTAGR
jgi:soluble lytic murein transglycosylase